MKNIIKGIWTVINSRIFLVLLFVAALAFGAQRCSVIQDLKRDQQIKDQNISALTDSLHFERNKNGDLNVIIDGYISSVKDLKNLNKGLFDEVKNQKGKVLSLNNVIIKLEQDKKDLQKYIDELKSKFDSIQQINDSTYMIPWILAYTYDSTNFDVFSGQTRIGALYDPTAPYLIRMNNLGSNLIHRETQIELTWGQKVVNDKLKVFVTSPYPGFTVESMQGVLIDPNNNPYIKDLIEKRHWFTGFSIGIGLSPGYNIVNQCLFSIRSLI